jgi:hypothetical protein
VVSDETVEVDEEGFLEGAGAVCGMGGKGW